MKYYLVCFGSKNDIDYAYSLEQLVEIIGWKKVKFIELHEDNKVIATYKSIKELEVDNE